MQLSKLFNSLIRRPMYFKTFLQKEVQPNEEVPTAPERKLFKTKTGKVPDDIYNKWLTDATSKALAIPEPDADIPYNFEGIDYIPDQRQSFLFEEMLNQNEILQSALLTHFTKIYKGALQSMVEEDQEFITEYFETRFAEKTIKALDALKQKGDTLEAFEDFAPTNGQPFPYQGFFIDNLIIRGLSMNREENKSRADYHYYDDDEEMGVQIYTPLSLSQPENFVTKEMGDKQYKDYKKVIARALVRIQSPLRLKLIKSNGQELCMDSDNYSYNHLVIFESQCEEPPKKRTRKFEHLGVKKFQFESYTEWMRNQVPRVWKLVDIDNYMQGNPLIIESDPYKDQIFKGSKYDLDVVDLRRI